MTNAIQEALRLAVLEPGDAVELPHWHELGLTVATTSARTGYRGAIEVAGKAILGDSAIQFLRNRLLNVGKPSSVSRYRLTRVDGVVVEGPFALELFHFDPSGFELLISCAGELVEKGERDPVAEAARNEVRIVALGEGATDAVRQVALTLIETRPPEVPLDDALSAVLAGGLTALVGAMLAADPTASPDEVEKALLEGVSAIVATVKK